jgi:3-deoxy-7-phosphoheptulonate synthase
MGFNYVREIPSEEKIVKDMPLSAQLAQLKRERDREIVDVLIGNSYRLLVIIGPCSADNEEAVSDYVRRLARLQKLVKDKIILIPRVYTNKPRTTGQGYKGMMHQPKAHEEPNIVQGLKAIRRLHLRIIKETGLSAADEMLYPENYPYLSDLLSYVTIGARSVENQHHRLTVSGLDIPVGMKNPTSGDLNVLLNSIQAAQTPHVFIYNRWEVKTPGNPYAHTVLRGAINKYGQSIPNYHYEDLIKFADNYLKKGFKNPAIIIDTNHANSNKQYKEQPRIVMEVMRSIRHSRILKSMVKGFMIESYIAEGAQEIPAKVFGKSITDPCLGWEDSEKLVLRLTEEV